MNDKQRAKLLKQTIRDIGITYKGVERLTGIPKNTVQQHCSGRPIKDEKLALICEKLNIDPKIFDLDVRNIERKEAM